MKLLGWGVVLWAVCVSPAIGRRQSSASGLARIGGVVLDDENPGAPVRRALVTVNGADVLVARTVTADDAGRFTVGGLPAGRYTLAAWKAGYLVTAYGARGARRAGTPVVLTDREIRDDLRLLIVRGAAITGRVTDAAASPVPHRFIRVLERRMTQAGPALVTVPAQSGVTGTDGPMTDDRGVYRLYALPPGEFLVVVGASGLPHGVFLPTTSADVARALRPPGAPAPPDDAEAPEPVVWAPTYYPGTPIVTAATPISLVPGQEAAGIDITLNMVRTSKLNVSAVSPYPASPTALVGQLLSRGSSGAVPLSALADGVLRLPSVAPGSYSVEIGTAPGRAPGGLALFGVADIEVNGQTQVDATVTLQPCASVAGQIELSSSPTHVAPLERPVRVTLTPDAALPGSMRRPKSVVSAGGTFVIRDVIPGRYRLFAESAEAAGSDARALWLLDASVAGRDAADRVVDIPPGAEMTDALVRFTDGIAELAGHVVDSAGHPVSGDHAILFAAESESWFLHSRRVREAGLAADGSFLLRAVPPGRYSLAVVTDAEMDEWFDPAFLADLPQSVSVTIALGQRTVQNLTVGGSLR